MPHPSLHLHLQTMYLYYSIYCSHSVIQSVSQSVSDIVYIVQYVRTYTYLYSSTGNRYYKYSTTYCTESSCCFSIISRSLTVLVQYLYSTSSILVLQVVHRYTGIYPRLQEYCTSTGIYRYRY